MGQLNEGGLIAACEGDVTSAAGMLALRHLSGGEVITLMDLSAVDETDDSVLLWHCGPTAPSLADDRGVRMQSLWLFDGYGGGGIGLHNDLVLRPGQATVFGFTTDFERVLVLDGRLDNRKPGYVGSGGWLRDLRLNGEAATVPDLIETLMGSGYQHHYPLAYGDLSGAALELAAWLGMRPIEAQRYRPYLTPAGD
jgi:L-fucose isomerase-like protein